MSGLEYILFVKELKAPEFAEEIGVSPSLFYHWLKGTRSIQEKDLVKLEELFSVSTEILLKRNLTSRDRISIEVALENGDYGDGSYEKTLRELEHLKRNFNKLLEENEHLHLKRKEDKAKIKAFINTL